MKGRLPWLLMAVVLAVALFVGSCLTIAIDRAVSGSIAWLPIALTILGMLLVLGGAGYMLLESQLGGAQVREEIERARARFGAQPRPSVGTERHGSS